MPRDAKDSGTPGVLDDPVVRFMAYAAVGLVILFLAAAIGVLATGIATPSGPRTAGERDLLLAAARTQGASGAALSPYVDALIAAGDLPAARVAIAQARGSAAATESLSGIDLAEARLMLREGAYEKAAELADKAMKGYKARYEYLVANAGDKAKEVRGLGYGEDYYNAALVKADALVKLQRFQEAVEALDIYIAENPTAADILIDRGNAKAELKDETGAEKDFRAALRFVPYDEEAKAGLKRIGVAQ